MLALFRTLSPQQLTHQQLRMLQQVGTPEPMLIEQPNFHDVLMPTGTSFFHTAHSLPSLQEVRVLTTLFLIHFEMPREDDLTVEKWQLVVESDAERIDRMGSKWHPINGGIWHNAKPLLLELEKALRVDAISSGGHGEIETVAAVLGNVSASEIYSSALFAPLMTQTSYATSE